MNDPGNAEIYIECSLTVIGDRETCGVDIGTD
jgi:hypothetical protein